MASKNNNNDGSMSQMFRSKSWMPPKAGKDLDSAKMHIALRNKFPMRSQLDLEHRSIFPAGNIVWKCANSHAMVHSFQYTANAQAAYMEPTESSLGADEGSEGADEGSEGGS